MFSEYSNILNLNTQNLCCCCAENFSNIYLFVILKKAYTEIIKEFDICAAVLFIFILSALVTLSTANASKALSIFE